jgi:hypothetical protein
MIEVESASVSVLQVEDSLEERDSQDPFLSLSILRGTHQVAFVQSKVRRIPQEMIVEEHLRS